MLIDSIFAPRCAACDRALSKRAPLCDSCAESLWPIETACPLCALPLEGSSDIACRRCRLRSSPLTATVVPYRYGAELAVAIRRLKYGRRADLARQLAPLLAAPLQSLALECDVVVPVPLHWRRELKRGYNQARILARFGLSRALRRRLHSAALRRVRHTLEQSGLPSAQRAANVRSAFSATARGRKRLRGARVLLVDDVITTGSTMRAAARALRLAGATAVIGFALARAA